MSSVLRFSAIGVLGLFLVGCSQGVPYDRRASSRADSAALAAGTPAPAPEPVPARAAETPAAAGAVTPTPPLVGTPISPEQGPVVTLDDFRRHFRDNTAVFIDARDAKDFDRGHVRGALSVPANEVATHMKTVRENASPGELIIIYCTGPSCHAAERVYEYLSAQGYGNMRVFKPGWETLASARDMQ